MNKEVIKMLNVELFSFSVWDVIDVDIQQFYDVEWKLDSLKEYNSQLITMTRNGDVEIYNGDGIEIVKTFNLSDNKEFISKLVK